MSELPFTKQDFIELDLDTLLANIDPKDVIAYGKALRSLLVGDPSAARVELVRIFSILAGDRPNTDTPDGPFEFVDRFGPDLLTFFAEIVDDVAEPEIKSRIADLLWCRTKDYKMAELAIDSYLLAAMAFEDFEQWVRTLQRLERAIQLASQLGRNNPKYPIVVAAVTDLLDRCNGEDPLYLSAELMRLFLERGEGDPTRYADFAEKLALNAEAGNRFDVAVKYWERKADWHFQAKDREKAREARIKLAESYEKESGFNFANRQPANMMAAYPIEKAIVAYRRAEGCEEKIEELKLKLRELQGEGVKEMPTISSDKHDISDIVFEAENAVKGKPFVDALITLAFLYPPSNVDRTRKQVEENRKTYLFSTLFPKRLFSASGRSIAMQATDEEGSILEGMFEYVGYSYMLVAKGMIEPARRVILEEHPSRMQDVYAVTSDNPLIHPEREAIVVRGLHAGLNGDYLVALHLLIPQFEESIRAVLMAKGVVPSSFYESGIQDEFNLNKLLTNPKFTEPLEASFGKDLIFDFRCALIERFGANLRNELAHGLLDYGAFYSPAAVYAWWLILKFYLISARTDDHGRRI